MKVKIWQEDLGHTRIAFYEEREGTIHIYNLYTGVIRKLELCEAVPQDFVLKIPHTLSAELLQSLAEALSEKGIKTDKDAKIAGTLEATRGHLEDMRRLVFRKK